LLLSIGNSHILSYSWLDEFHKVQSICLNTQQKDIFSQLLPHLPQKNSQCCFVGAISPHLTWSKTLTDNQTIIHPKESAILFAK
jgi:hypothetical protein